MLDKFEKFSQRISGWIEWVGVAGLLGIMVVTCVDVIGNKFFGSPLRGTTDIVQLFQLVAVAFACASTLIIGRHVQVEFIVNKLPRRVQAITISIVCLLELGLFILIIWRLIVLAHTYQTAGQYTPSAHIPEYPFAYGAAVACIPVCLVLIHQLMSSLVRLVKR